MDRKEYSLLHKLKKDKKVFDKKINLYESKQNYDNLIKTLIKNIKETRDKKNEKLKISENCENILKHYIAELNVKIFPHNWQKNYGDKNIETNLDNLSMLSYLQRVKRNAYIKDKYELENEVTDLFKEEDKKQVEKVKFHMAKDKIDGEIMENEKYQLSLIKDKFRQISHQVEKYEDELRIYKLKYEVIVQKNNKLKEMLNKEEKIYKKLYKLLKQKDGKNNNKNNLYLNIELNSENNKNNKNKEFLNYRSLSDKNFLSMVNTKKNSLKYFENIYKKNNIHISSTFLRNYIPNFKGYKSPLCFLKSDKNLEKKLFNKNLKLIKEYNALNIFTNNSKFDSIKDFINSFNNFTNSNENNTLSLNSTKDLKSTNINTFTSINSNIKNMTLSDRSLKSIKKKNNSKIMKRKSTYSTLYKKNDENKNEMHILNDYIYDLIREQRQIIKNLNNKKSEEMRSIYQIKFVLSKCINDLNSEVYEKSNDSNDNINNSSNINSANITESKKEKENLLYILTYIYDNCFNGINNNMESIFPEFRNNNKNKINSFFSNYYKDCCKNNSHDNEMSNRRCLSSTYRNYEN